MNVAVATRTLDVGDVFRCGETAPAILVKSGALELYVHLEEDGEIRSGRHYVLTVAGGEMLAPYFGGAAGAVVSAIATSPTVILPMAADTLLAPRSTAEFRASAATLLDGWFIKLCEAQKALSTAPPSDTLVVQAGAKVEAAAGTKLTTRSGLVWVSGPSLYLGQDEPADAGTIPRPLVPGLWLNLDHAGTVITSNTSDLMTAGGDATAATIEAHRQALARFVAHLRARDADAQTRVESRAARDAQLMERMTGRFVDVFDHAPAWTGAAAPDEPLLGPITMVAEALSIDLPLHIRTAIGRARTIDEAARAARVRQRRITLRGAWWRDDFGSFVGFLDEARRPVAVLCNGRGKWRIVDPDGGADIKVDGRTADRLSPIAHALYPPLAAKPLTIGDLSSFGNAHNAHDLRIALVAGAFMALLGLAMPLAMRIAFDRFIPASEKDQLFLLGVGLAIVAFIIAICRFAFDTAMVRMDARANGQTQAAVVDRVLRLPSYAVRFPSADLAMRASSVNAVKRGISSLMISAALYGMMWVVNLALMTFYSASAAVAVFGASLALIGFGYWIGTRQQDALRRGEALTSDVNSIVLQLLNGINVLRAGGAEDRAFARWGQDFAELRARSYRLQKLATVFETVLAGFDTLILVAILLLLALADRKQVPVGLVISFIASYGTFMMATGQLARAANAAMNLKPSWDRGVPLLKAVPEDSRQKRNLGVLSGAIELSQVHFRYSTEAPFALAGVSLSVEAGEFIAIVGASGCGKSTLMRMLLGADAPQGGSVTYDGVDLRHLDLELVRRQIGVVLQTGRLAPGSILENIVGSHDVTIDEAWEAARQAGIADEIKALPMGMHTILTEATAAFSGGQVQRLLIARALAGRPRVLLFDEATSALDNVTQQIVTESLNRLAVTRIVIAHRLTTVRQASRIVVLDQGRVVELGTFDQLAAAGGPFASLVGRQLL